MLANLVADEKITLEEKNSFLSSLGSTTLNDLQRYPDDVLQRAIGLHIKSPFSVGNIISAVKLSTKGSSSALQ